MKTLALRVALLLFVPLLSSITNAAITIDTVPVGNAGNTGEVQSQGIFGAVSYDYHIGKYEVTNDDYAAFLNAVAATDTHGLYDSNMGSDPRGGIRQSCPTTTTCSYIVKAYMGNKPVTRVSFWDAARFANWLHNGQPPGAQSNDTTEDGAYTLAGVTNPPDASVTRNHGAAWFIPSENEWYKAAYHKNDGVTGNYWDYPTSSDSAPAVATANETGDISNPGTNIANYARGADWNDQDGNVTTVGSAGVNSASPYGTFDQGGNVAEWNQSVLPSLRGFRGGGWGGISSSDLSASFRNFADPSVGYASVGFRVASIEPPREPGDFDGDLLYTCHDVDQLSHEIAAGSSTQLFDLNGDGFVDLDDLGEWLAIAGAANLPIGQPYLTADADLDGAVDVTDFNIWHANRWTVNASYCSGDFNASGVIDVRDFNIWFGNKFTSSDSVGLVPEPSAVCLLAIALVGLLGIVRGTGNDQNTR